MPTLFPPDIGEMITLLIVGIFAALALSFAGYIAAGSHREFRAGKRR